jgi:uncharacterized protein YkwD
VHHLRRLLKHAPQLLLCVILAAALGLTAAGTAMARGAAHGKARTVARHTTHQSCPARRVRSTARRCPPATHRVKSTKTRATRVRPPAKVKKTRVSTPAAAGTTSAPAGAAASIASVLASPCQNTELLPEAGNIPAVRTAVLCLINLERAQNEVPPLRINAELEAAAEGHAAELIQDDYFAHVSPSGETPVDRIRDTGYIPSPQDGYVIGENLAWGTYELSTPKAIVAAWIASPEHLANILEAKYVETGLGITPAVPSSLAAGAPGATYAEEFGVIIE